MGVDWPISCGNMFVFMHIVSRTGINVKIIVSLDTLDILISQLVIKLSIGYFSMSIIGIIILKFELLCSLTSFENSFEIFT